MMCTISCRICLFVGYRLCIAVLKQYIKSWLSVIKSCFEVIHICMPWVRELFLAMFGKTSFFLYPVGQWNVNQETLATMNLFWTKQGIGSTRYATTGCTVHQDGYFLSHCSLNLCLQPYKCVVGSTGDGEICLLSNSYLSPLKTELTALKTLLTDIPGFIIRQRSWGLLNLSCCVV